MVDPSAIISLIGFTRSTADLLLGVAAGFTLTFGFASYRMHLADETRLRTARRYLERHHRALTLLDSPDTPVEVLDLAIRLANLIIDERTPSIIAFALAENPRAFDGRSSDDGFAESLTQWSKILSSARPDLVEALSVANVAGLSAFLLRWPDCRAAFDDIMINLAASPVREAEHVIRETKRAMKYQNSPKVAAFAQ